MPKRYTNLLPFDPTATRALANWRNKRSGMLVAIRPIGRTTAGTIKETVWECRCDCGQICHVRLGNLRSGTSRSCGCRRYRTGCRHANWRGHGEISGNFWDGVCQSARARGIPMAMTVVEAWELFLRQGRRCALSGLALVFAERSTRRGTASLDRIDSENGYTLDNVQWVHRDINLMKNTLATARFIQLCRCVAKQAKKGPYVDQKTGVAERGAA